MGVGWSRGRDGVLKHHGLEKWCRRTDLQGRNRDTDVENKRMDTKGGKVRG